MKISLPQFHCELETDSETAKWWINAPLWLRLSQIKMLIESLVQRDIELGYETLSLIDKIYSDWDNWYLIHDFAHHHSYFMMIYLETIEHPEWDNLFNKLDYFRQVTYKCMVLQEKAA